MHQLPQLRNLCKCKTWHKNGRILQPLFFNTNWNMHAKPSLSIWYLKEPLEPNSKSTKAITAHCFKKKNTKDSIYWLQTHQCLGWLLNKNCHPNYHNMQLVHTCNCIYISQHTQNPRMSGRADKLACQALLDFETVLEPVYSIIITQ